MAYSLKEKESITAWETGNRQWEVGSRKLVDHGHLYSEREQTVSGAMIEKKKN